VPDLPEDVRGLLASLRDALILPSPHWGEAEQRAHHRALIERARIARIALDGVLDDGHGPADSADWIDRKATEVPIAYRLYVPEGAPRTRPESPGRAINREGTVVFEVEQSGADSDGWDPDDPYGQVEEYEMGGP
jgi:hypothetical protein